MTIKKLKKKVKVNQSSGGQRTETMGARRNVFYVHYLVFKLKNLPPRVHHFSLFLVVAIAFTNMLYDCLAGRKEG